jgi:hypothetical protein
MWRQTGNGVVREIEECVTWLAYESTRKNGNAVETAVRTCIVHSKKGEWGSSKIVIKILYLVILLVLFVAARINTPRMKVRIG